MNENLNKAKQDTKIIAKKSYGLRIVKRRKGRESSTTLTSSLRHTSTQLILQKFMCLLHNRVKNSQLPKDLCASKLTPDRCNKICNLDRNHISKRASRVLWKWWEEEGQQKAEMCGSKFSTQLPFFSPAEVSYDTKCLVMDRRMREEAAPIKDFHLPRPIRGVSQFTSFPIKLRTSP